MTEILSRYVCKIIYFYLIRSSLVLIILYNSINSQLNYITQAFQLIQLLLICVTYVNHVCNWIAIQYNNKYSNCPRWFITIHITGRTLWFYVHMNGNILSNSFLHISVENSKYFVLNLYVVLCFTSIRRHNDISFYVPIGGVIIYPAA